MKKTNYAELADQQAVDKTVASLRANGFNVSVTSNATEAIAKAQKLIPKGSEVMTATSRTLESLRLDKLFNSSKYKSVKNKLTQMDKEKDYLEMQKIGAAPEYVIGSVHAITEDGKILVASNTGSQLPSYSYAASHVVWIISTKKITKDVDDGINRIYKHVLPLETARIQKAYGMKESEVKKLLIINKEINPDRIHIILIKEDLGF